MSKMVELVLSKPEYERNIPGTDIVRNCRKDEIEFLEMLFTVGFSGEKNLKEAVVYIELLDELKNIGPEDEKISYSADDIKRLQDAYSKVAQKNPVLMLTVADLIKQLAKA